MIDFVLNFAIIYFDSKFISYPKFLYINKIILSYPLQYLIPNQKNKTSFENNKKEKVEFDDYDNERKHNFEKKKMQKPK